MLISDAVHIWREPDGDYHIEWQASHPGYRSYRGAPGRVAPHAVALQRAVGSCARLSGLAPAIRHFFRLRDQHGTEVLATERKLGMQGTPNFRDFGGYRTVDGRRLNGVSCFAPVSCPA